MLPEHVKQFFAIIVIILLTFVMIYASTHLVNAKKLTQGDLRPTETKRVDGEIAYFLELINNEELNPDRRATLERRLEGLYYEATLVEKAKKVTPPTPHGPNYTPQVTLEGLIIQPTGLLEHPAIWGQDSIHIENAWVALIDNEYILVSAGCLKSDPDQGVVTYEKKNSGRFVVKTTKKSGCISFIEGKDKEKTKAGKLTLKSKKGEHFFFDVPARKFISSLDEVVPTITPESKIIAETPTISYPYP